ncbi:hypothetical protein PYW08_014447 [Mythimna loreyi]|uniref:Uncharacterized protein n=1 Tax=Mythimna loreyi TaxID=667449 RepID=A0ACC2R4A6_9NEOP|nr:hypothetical protein PYW08_014447 [Mythimna loreyi]
MVGYSRLAVRRDVALCSFVFRVLRGWLQLPELLAELGLRAPAGCGGARRPTPTLMEPYSRTNLNRFSPLSRAIRVLNIIAIDVDLFHCSLPRFTEAALKCIEYNGTD